MAKKNYLPAQGPSTFNPMYLLGRTLVCVDFEKRDGPDHKGVISEIGVAILDLTSVSEEDVDVSNLFNDLAARIQQYHWIATECLLWPKHYWNASEPFKAAGCKTHVLPQARIMEQLRKLLEKVAGESNNIIMAYWDATLEQRIMYQTDGFSAILDGFQHWDVQLSVQFEAEFKKARTSATKCLAHVNIPNRYNGVVTQHNACNDATNTLLKYLILATGKDLDEEVDLRLVFSKSFQEYNKTLGWMWDYNEF